MLGASARVGDLNLKETSSPYMLKKQKTVHFVLAHGASEGSWIWYKLKCLMETSGYRVSCVDFKASGIDPSDPNLLHSFDDYNKPLTDLLSALPENEPVILVGHSAAGLSVTHFTIKFPKKILLAVYLAAPMLKHGFATAEDIEIGSPDLSEYGDVSEVEYGLGPDQPPTSGQIKKEFQRQLLMHMSPQEDVTLAAMLLRPGPLRALSTRFGEEAEVDKVPRVYIKTLQDQVVNPEHQDAMVKKWPPAQVYALDSDHSPFFSCPFVLFGLLIKAAASVGL